MVKREKLVQVALSGCYPVPRALKCHQEVVLAPTGRATTGEGAMFDRVSYEMYRGTLETWDQLFRRAAQFASQLLPEQLINISHSEDGNDGVVVVWYWQGSEDGEEEPE